MKPIIASFGSLHLHSYGLMVAVGILVCLWLMIRRAQQDGFPKVNDAYDFVFIILLFGFLGGRFLYVLQNAEWYARHPASILAFWEGGLIFYGGMFGAFLGFFVFLKLKRLPFLKSLDFVVPFIALAHAFGRIGCFLNGCCYGRLCDLPWAVQFPNLPTPVHPTQLYEVLYNLALFLFLNYRYSRKKFDGEIAADYFMGYAVGRFAIEFWRADNPSWQGLTWNQWESLGLFFVVLAWLIYLRRNIQKTSIRR